MIGILIKIGHIILGIILLGVGTLIIVAYLDKFRQRKRLKKSGIETEATVISVDRDTVVYGYTVSETQYEGSGIPAPGHRIGAIIKILYHADNPKESIFAADMRKVNLVTEIGCMLIALVLMAGGVMFFIY